MKPLKTLFVFEGTGTLLLCSTIFYEDKLWLVPYWKTDPERKYSRPERIILLETIPHQKSDGTKYDFLLNDPVPKAVFAGLPYAQKEVAYVIRENPEIEFPYDTGLHGETA